MELNLSELTLTSFNSTNFKMVKEMGLKINAS
jgi:hypothetical protein